MALSQRLALALTSNEAPVSLLAGLLRGLARADQKITQTAVVQVLQHPQSKHPEVLATIGGRCWESLHSPPVVQLYLETLAEESVGQDIFNHCLADLLRLPSMQPQILGALRSPDRSPRVAAAFQAMLG